jgi:flagellar hook-length control protein FliK
VPPELPTAPKPAGAARDIKLQVAGAGPQRVEVHLSERAGQVQVAVRTPDSHLSDALREHLPTLTTRLAESGIRAETWHPSAPAEWQRNTETSHAGLVQDHNPQSGGQQQEQQSGGDARRPKAPEAPTQTKQKGKDFAWLMSTLQ